MHSRVIINDLERLVSDDPNNTQLIAAADRDDLLGRALVCRPQAGLLLPGQTVIPTGAVGAPLQAAVIDGLRVCPDAAAYLLVEAGTLVAWTGTPVGYESGYTLVNDPGVTSTGTLLFTPNGGPGVRIDLIECSIADTVLASESRDVYDIPTGLFNPATLTKLARPRLVYRVTVGVQGAGIPAFTAGWLPLAVAIVQPGAVGWTEADFYDVRPLVNDRVDSAVAGDSDCPLPAREGWLEGYGDYSANTYSVRGVVRRGYHQYYAGGPMFRSTPSAIADMGVAGAATTVDLHVAGNLAPGANMGSYDTVLLAGFPAGLPRWARYSQTAIAQYGGRRGPYGPLGIVFASTGNLLSMGSWQFATGVVSAVFPAICGFGATAYPAVVLAAMQPRPSESLPEQFVMTGRELLSASSMKQVPATVGGTDEAYFNFSGGPVPGDATALIVDFWFTSPGSPTGYEWDFYLIPSGGAPFPDRRAMLARHKIEPVSPWPNYGPVRVRVPLRKGSSFPGYVGMAPAYVGVVATHPVGSPVISAGTADIMGYEF